jgi:serine/threonine protein kinase
MFSRIKHYRILREIGGGGFAKVYLAQDTNLKREVAVKVLHANLAESSDFRRFFEREAQLVAALEHLAVVPIYDYGETGGQLYLVMRCMRGGTLSDRLEQTKRALTLAEIIKLLEHLAPTLDAIHARGVIHRDLKPSNILYDDAGSSYIADFGIARMQQATSRLTQTAHLPIAAGRRIPHPPVLRRSPPTPVRINLRRGHRQTDRPPYWYRWGRYCPLPRQTPRSFHPR